MSSCSAINTTEIFKYPSQIFHIIFRSRSRRWRVHEAPPQHPDGRPGRERRHPPADAAAADGCRHSSAFATARNKETDVSGSYFFNVRSSNFVIYSRLDTSLVVLIMT